MQNNIHLCSILMLFVSIFLGTSCSHPENLEKKTKSKILSPIEKVEKAHEKNSALEKEAIQFDIVLSFGGSERLNGTLTLTTNSTKGLFQLNDSSEILYTDGKVYYSNPEKNPRSIRFSAYTWSYFMLFPYKLSDPGTNWTDVEKRNLDGQEFDFQKLTFNAGIGDAPDDWYLMYTNPENNLIEYAAYIVTAGSTREEAEIDPHAIQYLNYQEIDGVPFAHNWIFWEWREQAGLTKELGKASLSNFKFVPNSENLFKVKDAYLQAD